MVSSTTVSRLPGSLPNQVALAVVTSCAGSRVFEQDALMETEFVVQSSCGFFTVHSVSLFRPTAVCRTPAREEPADALPIAEPAPNPVNDDQLDLARTARRKPSGLIDVVPGHYEIGRWTLPPSGNGRVSSIESRIP